MIKEKDVIKKLKECYDPEVPINIVDLGLIYDIKIKNNNILVKMTLTTPHCPMGSFILQDVEEKLKSLKGVKDVKVELVWNHPWTPNKMSKGAKKRIGFV